MLLTAKSGPAKSPPVESIREKIRERTLDTRNIDVAPFVEAILKRYGNKVVGIYMYGSVLSKVTKSTTSFPDFFVVTDGYRGVFQDFSHWLLAYFLPPHIYHLRLSDSLRCKYNLVSLGRFKRECSKKAKDIYILGRFGKRVALVYSREERSRDELVNCCHEAMSNVAIWTLRGLQGSFNEEIFTLDCLNLSYVGETRVETSSKVPKLFEAEKDFYLEVYPELLKRSPRAQKMFVPDGDGHFKAAGSGLRRWLRRLRFRWFLKKSRIRGILRWPKFLVTVDEWVDIILAKIERTKGIKIELSARQRRHPLIFGWGHFLRLMRAGAIKSASESSSTKKKEL